MSDARENTISGKRKIETPTSNERTKSKKIKRSNTHLQDDDEDFPRGGSNTLTPLEVRRVKDEAEKDINLFATPASRSKKKAKSTTLKKKKQKEIDYDESGNDDILVHVTKDTTKGVDSLSFKKLSKGILLLGVVQEVFNFELLVSLPNNLSGCVHITNINELFTSQLEEEATESEDAEQNGLARLQKFFPIGTIVRCAVVSTDPSKHGHSKIRLSVDPTDVNSSLTSSLIYPNLVLSGYVTSIEDHGYAVSLGIDGITGFISTKNASGELCIGQVMDCLVTSTSPDKRLVQLMCNKDKISSVIASQVEKVVFSSLLPGMLVKATVKKVRKSGLVVSFLGGFDGSLDLVHLKDNGGSGEDLEETYPCKRRILSRIIYVCPLTKTIGLSELQNLVDNEASIFQEFSIGDVIEEATVLRLEQRKGLLLQLSENVSGYAHISRLSNEHLTKIDKKFQAGTKHSCRILSLNTLVGLALVTLDKSVISEPFIRYQDIKPGVVVTGQLQSLLKSGMLVSLSDHIRGFCPSLHFADVTLKCPEKKLQEGKKVKCRVLEVEAERKRLRLTHKKTLVNSELTPITNYSDIELGMKTHGFITSIRDYGCIVHFYNNVHGLVPRANLGLKASENAQDAFYVGQVVTCVVISCCSTKQRLSLSFNMSAKPYSLDTKRLMPGTLVDVDIIGKADSGLDVQIKPSNTPAFLPRMHLSDHVTHCGPLLQIFSQSLENAEVKSLSNVLYYGRNKDKTHFVSRKQSLIKMATEECLVKRFEDLQVGVVLSGFTRKHMPYGIFIEFSPSVYGLAPNSLLSDKFIADSSQHFQIGQSVHAKIIEIDSERRRFLVSLKASDCYPEEQQDEEKDNSNASLAIDLLDQRIQERDEILGNLQNTPESDSSLVSILPGSLVTAKVTAVKNYGVTLRLESGVEGFAPPELVKGTETSVGEVFDAIVLDYDIENETVYVTADSNIIRERKETNVPVKKKIKPGVVVPAIVQIIHAEYMVVLLPNHGFRVAYVPVKANLNDIRDPASRFTVGQSCNATVQRYVSSKFDKRNYLIVTVRDDNERKDIIQPGEIVTGIVKAVKELQMNVHLFGGRYHGRVHVTEILDDPVEGANPLVVYTCGEKVQVKVLGFRDTKNHKFLPITHRNYAKAVAELSIRPSRLREDDEKNEEKKPVKKELAEYKEGEKILCFVKSIRSSDIWMSVSTSVDGRVALLDVSTDIKVLQDLSSHFKLGTAHNCTVISVDKEHNSLNLSMLGCDVKKGEVVAGKIINIFSNSGLAVHLPRRKSGMVFLTDVNDKFKENPLDGYSVNQLVSCYILGVNESGQIDLSTRPSKTEGTTTEVKSCDNDKDIQTLSDIEEGDLVRGYIKRCSDVGVFVSLSRHVVARVQIKNLSRYFVKKWKPFFPVGKLVKGKILSINPSNNFIELSLKGNIVGGDDPVPKPERRKQSESTNSKRTRESSESEDEGISLKKHRKDDENEEPSDVEENSDTSCSKDSSDECDSEEDVDEEAKPRLKLSGGFDWNSFNNEDVPTDERAVADSDDDDMSEVGESAQVARKKSKRAKRAAKKAEEEFLYKTEQALLEKDKGPQTAEDFDRVLLATPNDSLLWLQYMAFNLHLTEVDKARAVAERALKSISFREESEKFNIWVALLNLENSYGTQESLVDVFQRALQQNEPKMIFKQLINIYIKSKKYELAEQLYQTMLKRFKCSKKVWVEYASYLMERGEVESARNVLQKSLKSLEKRKHIETITRFAMLEFKHGEPERGKTLFDNVLTSYPKRTDIWSVYVDVLIRNGDIDAARRLLERAATLQLSSRKMKFIFKKYLEFEKKHGDETSVESVKKMAEGYVREKTG